MTVEEKAEKYAMDFVKSKYSDIYSVDAKFAFNAVKHDWLAGHAEAIRWRDPKIELPEEGVDVFVKMIRSGEYGEQTIYTSSHVVNNFYHDSESNPFGCEGYYVAGNGGRVRVTVIGWRPIE